MKYTVCFQKVDKRKTPFAAKITGETTSHWIFDEGLRAHKGACAGEYKSKAAAVAASKRYDKPSEE